MKTPVFKQAGRVSGKAGCAQIAGKQALIFRLADRECALSLDAVREVVPIVELARPPGLPALLEGFLNLGGQSVPVLSLRRLFGLPDDPPGLYTPLVVLSNPNGLLALLVDRVVDIRILSGEALMAVRGTHIFNNCVQAEFSMGGRTVHLLSPEKLLLEEERRRIEQLREMEQRRIRELEGAREA